MTEAAALEGGERVLEIGTGSGYQAAVLAELAREVYTIEIVAPLAARARRDARARSATTNVHIAHGRRLPRLARGRAVRRDPRHGRARPRPAPLLERSWPRRPPGRSPSGGSGGQDLWLFTKTERGLERKRLMPVRFVPLRSDPER